MEGQHFKEVVGIVCMTAGITKAKLCSLLDVTPKALWLWENNGLPTGRKMRVMNTLRSLIRSGKHEGAIH